MAAARTMLSKTRLYLELGIPYNIHGFQREVACCKEGLSHMLWVWPAEGGDFANHDRANNVWVSGIGNDKGSRNLHKPRSYPYGL